MIILSQENQYSHKDFSQTNVFTNHYFLFQFPSKPLFLNTVHTSSSSASPAIFLGFTILGAIFVYVTVFLVQP